MPHALDLGFPSCRMPYLSCAEDAPPLTHESITIAEYNISPTLNFEELKTLDLSNWPKTSLLDTDSDAGNLKKGNKSIEAGLADSPGYTTTSDCQPSMVDDFSLTSSMSASCASSSECSANRSIASPTPDCIPSGLSTTAKATALAPVPVCPAAGVQRCVVCRQLFASVARLQ